MYIMYNSSSHIQKQTGIYQSRHVYTKADRHLSIAGMYIQKQAPNPPWYRSLRAYLAAAEQVSAALQADRGLHHRIRDPRAAPDLAGLNETHHFFDAQLLVFKAETRQSSRARAGGASAASAGSPATAAAPTPAQRDSRR